MTNPDAPQQLYQRGPGNEPMLEGRRQTNVPFIPAPFGGLFKRDDAFGEAGHWRMPRVLHGWHWTAPNGPWRALVTFPDGWTGFTSPMPAPKVISLIPARWQLNGLENTVTGAWAVIVYSPHGTENLQVIGHDKLRVQELAQLVARALNGWDDIHKAINPDWAGP